MWDHKANVSYTASEEYTNNVYMNDKEAQSYWKQYRPSTIAGDLCLVQKMK